jgi:hypothetical protein
VSHVSSLRLAVLCAALIGCGGGGGGGGGGNKSGTASPDFELALDFQADDSVLATGFIAVAPEDVYSEDIGWGWEDGASPSATHDGTEHTWKINARVLSVSDVIPDVVLDASTIDGVSADGSLLFHIDVPAGTYDLTVWVGDVTRPLNQLRIQANDVIRDVDRLEINHTRGSFDENVFGSSVPCSLTVSAPDGRIDLMLGPQPGASAPVTWTYEQDEAPNKPPVTKTATLLPAYGGASLTALTLHGHQVSPLVRKGGKLVLGDAPSHPALKKALDAFNANRPEDALAALQGLSDPGLQAVKAAGLFWVAGHPGIVQAEEELLTEAESLLEAVLLDDDQQLAAHDLLLQVRLALSAEESRAQRGYSETNAPAAENFGRSCNLVEELPPDHPYWLKGRILWIRNRGGLDPNRVTVTWERAQWKAQEMLAEGFGENPFVRLYATDEWDEGVHWEVLDWEHLVGSGPLWARGLVVNLNSWLDLFEWWSVNRQSALGDLGGGWTDDVEMVPAFALMSYVLDGASDVSRDTATAFADGLWQSPIIDQSAGYSALYADVEHTAEPTGNILHLAPLLRLGEPQGIERMLASVRTFRDLFTKVGTDGQRRFLGNHLSATAIALNPAHRADIPLCGRVTAPFPFLLWYTDLDDVDEPLQAWTRAWLESASRTDQGKPSGIFPQLVWSPTGEPGSPTGGPWSAASPANGQFTKFPTYQEYLYGLAGNFALRTGDPAFLAPFDALRDAALAYAAAGKPSLPPNPPASEEQLWAGGKLAKPMLAQALNLALASGSPAWNSYLDSFAKGYARFRLNPVDPTPIGLLAAQTHKLRSTWPYRTTEGIMTDRIMITGWWNVVSYYLGADALAMFSGMPVHAVTWEGTSRLFAAAVTKATSAAVEVSTFLCHDVGRTATVRLWQLELGATYQLEAGPALGMGQPPTSIAQSVVFTYDHIGQRVPFQLPGRTTYALRVKRLSSGPPTTPRSDLGAAAQDVTWDAENELLRVHVHNVGSVAADSFRVDVHSGADSSAPAFASEVVSGLLPPIDLRPSVVRLSFPHDGSFPVTVAIDAADDLLEITEENNQVTVYASGSAGELSAPALHGIQPSKLAVDETARLTGREVHPHAPILRDGSPRPARRVCWVEPGQLAAARAAGIPSGAHLLTVLNPNGKVSNPLLLTVED